MVRPTGGGPMATQDIERRAFDDGRLYSDEIERLRLLLEASSTLLGSLSVETMLPEILELASRTLAADAYALWRRDDADGRWSVAAHAGLAESYVENATEAIRGGEADDRLLDSPLVVEDVAAADWLNPAHRQAHAEAGTCSMLVSVLRYGERIVGTLAFYYREPRKFSEAEKNSASLLANLAAAAIGTAELYDAQRRLAEDQRFVAAASELLASSLEYESTLANVASLAVPQFADWCTIDMVEEDGSLSRLAVAHVDAEKVRLADELAARYPPDPDAAYGVPSVIRSGTSELIPEISDEILRDATRDTPELYELLVELGLRSSMCVPLVARDRVVGALTFIAAESGRNFEEHDLVTAEELARHAATAVDNALLYREARENERQLRLLAQTSDVLASSLDYDATLQAVARLAVPAFADWCIVDVVEAEQIRRVAVAAADPDQDDALRELQRRFQPTWDSPQPAARALRSGAPVVFEAFDAARLRETVRDEDHYAL